ncbi:MAG: S8 family peptidase, partial [Actinomycetota bacterium]
VPVPAEALAAPPVEQWTPPVTVAVLDTGLDPHPWFAGRPWLSEWGLQPEVLDADGDAESDQ